MKKFFIKALFIFVVFNCSYAISMEYQTTSPYWSTSKNGPTSMNQAIEMFFKDRQLDPLEGVWMESNWGLVAIVKDDNVYKKYVISVDYSGLNGTHETTYLKTASPNVYTFFTRISWKDGSWYVFKTSTGTLFLKNNNFAERTIDRYAANPEGTLIRNWPTDFNEHNTKIESGSENENEGDISWYKVAISKDKEVTSYVDLKTVKKKNDKIFFTTLDSLTKPIEFSDGSIAYSAIDKIEGNCTDYSARFLQSIYYQKIMGKGKIVRKDYSISEWKNYNSSSMLRIVLTYVCKKEKIKNFEEENPPTDSSEKETKDDWF